jgi:hypothetical protein
LSAALGSFSNQVAFPVISFLLDGIESGLEDVGNILLGKLILLGAMRVSTVPTGVWQLPMQPFLLTGEQSLNYKKSCWICPAFSTDRFYAENRTDIPSSHKNLTRR